MNEKTIETLYTVFDGADDRSPGKPKWYFELREMAGANAEGKGYFGSDAKVEALRAIKIGDEIHIVSHSIPLQSLNVGPNTIEQIKREALDKLTHYEREILGL